MLAAPSPRRERILVFGPSGSGKSSTWTAIANTIIRTKSPAHLYVVDTDHAYDAMYDPSYDPIITVHDAERANFPEWVEVVSKWRPHLTSDDWIITDMVDQVRTAAKQHYWHEKTGGYTLGEVSLRGEVDDAFDTVGPYGKHEGNINDLYGDFMTAFLNVPCHVLAITPAQQVMLDKQGMAINEKDQEFVKFRYRPTGHWRLPHHFHTILLTREIPGPKGSQWNLTTVKERGPIGKANRRQYLTGELVTEQLGFVGAYLMKVAGWHL